MLQALSDLWERVLSASTVPYLSIAFQLAAPEAVDVQFLGDVALEQGLLIVGYLRWKFAANDADEFRPDESG